MKRVVPLLALAAACSSPSYEVGADGGDAASAILARDGSTAKDSGTAEGGAAEGGASDASASEAGEERIQTKDAGTPTETTADGGQVPLASSLPDWARPLLGQYVARSYSFAQDKAGTLIRTREYLRVDVVETSGADPHVELQLHLCDSFGEGMTADSQVQAPALATVRVHRVLFGKDSWATQAAAAADGFTRPLPARCVGKEGQWVGKDAAQTWILGEQCLCPASVDSAPNQPEDCRVIDQDQDLNPGSTMRITPKVLGLGPTNLFVATINQTSFVNGTVAADGRHTAQLAVDTFGWQLGCDPACTDISATPAPCPPARSKLELVRADDTSCAQLIAQATTLFPTALPGYPNSCP